MGNNELEPLQEAKGTSGSEAPTYGEKTQQEAGQAGRNENETCFKNGKMICIGEDIHKYIRKDIVKIIFERIIKRIDNELVNNHESGGFFTAAAYANSLRIINKEKEILNLKSEEKQINPSK